MSATFDNAVTLARKALARDRASLEAEQRVGYTIVAAGPRRGVGAFLVFRDTGRIPVVGTVAARVDLDGHVVPVGIAPHIATAA